MVADNMAESKCHNCGSILRANDTFCGTCGRRVAVAQAEPSTASYPHKLATALGYIFAIFSGGLGIVFGIYLWTRDDPKAKFHGKIIIGLTISVIVLALILLQINSF
jgi:hypothetical protein